MTASMRIPMVVGSDVILSVVVGEPVLEIYRSSGRRFFRG